MDISDPGAGSGGRVARAPTATPLAEPPDVAQTMSSLSIADELEPDFSSAPAPTPAAGKRKDGVKRPTPSTRSSPLRASPSQTPNLSTNIRTRQRAPL